MLSCWHTPFSALRRHDINLTPSFLPHYDGTRTSQFLIMIPVFIILTNTPPSSCLIRTFLQAGKHVCVEYPMTMDYRAAVELWDIAQKKGDTDRSNM